MNILRSMCVIMITKSAFYRLIYNMKKILFLLFSMLSMTVAAQNEFAGSKWIGAICKSQTQIPEGRHYSGGVLNEQKVKEAWAAVDTLVTKSIFLKRNYHADRKIAKAEVNICGLGFYELMLNDSKVGDAVLAPLWSDYDKTLFYNTYDVTAMLRNGDNEIKVLLGNGFFNEHGKRYHKMKISFGPPTLIFEMNISYADGTKETIVSDGTWQWALSNITFNSIYGGEDYDARITDFNWKPVVVQQAPKGKLTKQITEPIKIMERFGVKEVLMSVPFEQLSKQKVQTKNLQRLLDMATNPRPSSLNSHLIILDMGQNLAGFPEITVKGKAGQQVKLTMSEKLDKAGLCDQSQTGRPHYYVYTLSGKGKETWHPRFSYYGFRYIQVEGAVMKGEPNPKGLPVIHDIKSCFIYNSARKISTFECSNELINDTHWLIDRAIRSNWQAVFTDCPHREKLGWLEQHWLNGEALVYNYDARTMIEQTVLNISDAQHANGAVPTTAPQYAVFPGETWGKPFNESPEWGGAFIALPFLYKQHYDSDKLIRQYYGGMLRYVDYLATQDNCYILDQGLGDWYDYWEGKAGFAHNTSVKMVSTAHYYKWTRMMADAADIVGNSADKARLSARADSIAAAIIANFYDAQKKTFDTGSQAANSIAICMGLVPKGDEEAVMMNIENNIRKHGFKLTTGDIGNRYLFNALAKNGKRDILYRMLDHYDVPGYGYQLTQGMTTLSEQWDPRMGSSLNHFMQGHIENLIIPDLLGININGSNVLIEPHPVKGLEWCKGSTECNAGKVSVQWMNRGGRFSLTVTVPDGAKATVVMPSGKRIDNVKGTQVFEE